MAARRYRVVAMVRTLLASVADRFEVSDRHLTTASLGVCLLCLGATVPVAFGALSGALGGATLGYTVPVLGFALLVAVAALVGLEA